MNRVRYPSRSVTPCNIVAVVTLDTTVQVFGPFPNAGEFIAWKAQYLRSDFKPGSSIRAVEMKAPESVLDNVA